MISRILEETIRQQLQKPKALVLMGPRQVGKSTLLHSVFDGNDDALWIDADNIDSQTSLEDASSEVLKTIIGDHKILIIDEAQSLTNAGLTLKRITDYLPDVKLIATGSSSFELADKVKEALTGRKREYRLFPVAFSEAASYTSVLDEMGMLEHRLIYGYYPEVVANPGEEKEILSGLSSDYLYKDILKIEGIKKTDSIVRLIKALALQIGNTVSYNEIGQICGLDAKTVEKYVDVLEQSFVVFKIGSFSRNLRNELKKSKKIYFYDLGIRNSILNNYAPFSGRSNHERGALWENFLMVERMKRNEYSGLGTNRYFWRTKEGKELDYIEEYDGVTHAYEFKLSRVAEHIGSGRRTFEAAYPESSYELINRDNFLGFVSL